MKQFLLLLAITFFYFQSGYAQSVHACCNDTICIPGTSVTLNATVDSGNVATLLGGSDDTYSSLIPVKFNFTFFGKTHTNCILSSNGILSFDTTKAGQAAPFVIENPAPSAQNPLNAIYLPWQDLNPSAGGTIAYGTFGNAPNLVFVFDFCAVPLYNCKDSVFSGQVVLHETSNIIDIYIQQKQICASWNFGSAILGLQDASGTIADIVPGRNYPQQWNASNEGWEFTPSGNNYSIQSVKYNPVQLLFLPPTWLANGSPIGTGYSITVNPQATTVYTATVGLCSNNSDQVTVFVENFNLNIALVNPTCASATNGVITATPIGDTGPYDFVWKNSSGQTIRTTNNVNSDALQNLAPGTYTVTATNRFGCVTTQTINLSPQTPTAVIIAFNSSCISKNVSFTTSPVVGATNFAWNFGDGSTTNTTVDSTNHTYNQSGNFTVSLTVTFQGGCTATATHSITIFASAVADFSFSPNDCVGQLIQFTDHSSPAPIAWSWSFGDGSSSFNENPTHSYVAPNNYNVTLTVTDSICGLASVSKTLNVVNAPQPDLGPDTSYCPDQMVTLNANVPNATYLWSTGATTESITVTITTQPASYFVTVTNNGCIGSDTVNITPNCAALLPSAFSPNGDGKNDIFHPLGSGLASFTLMIYNRWGEVVFNSGETSDTNVGWDGTFNGQDQPLGVYVYTLAGKLKSGQDVKMKGNVTLVR